MIELLTAEAVNASEGTSSGDVIHRLMAGSAVLLSLYRACMILLIIAVDVDYES
jgi:hypothetical protein